jgi:hypothetical protein
MTVPELAALRPLALKVLKHRAPADSDTNAVAVALAARRAYDELARILAPLIGEAGMDALAARAVHLVQRQYPWLAKTRDPEPGEGPFTHASFSLEPQAPGIAAEAAAAVLATFTGLLATLIGEPLTARVTRQAWPDGFSDAGTEET